MQGMLLCSHFSLVADRVLFNSYYNMESFLSSIDRFLRLMPDYRQKGLVDVLGPKCSVLYFPLTLEDRLSPVCSSGAICQAEQLSSEVSSLTKSFDNTKLEATEGLSSFVVNEIRLPSPPLHIVWNHRWYVVKCFYSDDFHFCAFSIQHLNELH